MYTKVLDKKAFDPEYRTQWRKEVEFLKLKHIEPTFIKTSEYGIKEYKYKKTIKLFAALTEFYIRMDTEKKYRMPKKVEEPSDTPSIEKEVFEDDTE